LYNGTSRQVVPKVAAALHGAAFFVAGASSPEKWSTYGFFPSAVDTLQTLVIALGAGLGVWGVVNLLEGYGSDNPGAKSQGMKQLMAGGGHSHSLQHIQYRDGDI